MAEVIAASRSALARSSLCDIAMSSPSEETAMASMTSGVLAANWLSNQLNCWASVLRWSAYTVMSASPQGWTGGCS